MGEIIRFPGMPRDGGDGPVEEVPVAGEAPAEPGEPRRAEAVEPFWLDPEVLQASWGDMGPPDRILMCDKDLRRLFSTGWMHALWSDHIERSDSKGATHTVFGVPLFRDDTVPPGRLVLMWERGEIRRTRVCQWQEPTWRQVEGPALALYRRMMERRRIREDARQKLVAEAVAGALSDSSLQLIRTFLDVPFHEFGLMKRLRLILNVAAETPVEKASQA